MNGGSKGRTIDSHVASKHSMEGSKVMTQGNGKMSGGGKTAAGPSKKSTPAGRQFAPGKAVDGSTIQGAVDELYYQHPHNWNDLGPHHGGKENEVHEPHPYEGLSPNSGRGKDPSINSKG